MRSHIAIQVTPQIAQFRTSKPWRDKLAELLKDNVMQEALKAVMSMASPRSIPAHVPGVHHDTTIAHQYYGMLGIVEAVSALEFLTTDGGPSGGLTHPEEEDFVSTIPKEYQEMPEAVKNQK